jgi:hypothetical protein
LECWVYLEGRCPVPEEMTLETPEDEERHKELYETK